MKGRLRNSSLNLDKKDQNDSYSDGEMSYLLQRALFIQPASRPIDLDTVPADGHEFIHKERLESAALVFPAPFISNESECKTTTVKKASLRKVVEEFSSFATRFKNCRNKLKEMFEQNQKIPLEDEAKCCTFCLGSELSSSLYEDQICESVTKGHLPLLSLVIHLPTYIIMKLISYHFKWYKSLGMKDIICVWFFALFACLEKPITEKQEEFLEDIYDDCKSRLKECKNSEYVRLRFISTLLADYFCVKYSEVGPDLEQFKKLKFC